MSRDTLREIGLALLAGLLTAVSPFTPNELGPSAAAGLAVAAALYFYRARHRKRRPEADAQDMPAPAADPVPRILLPASLLYLAVFAPTFSWLYQHWTASIWVNNHGLFIPFVVAYLIYSTLRRDTSPRAETSKWGFLFLAMGLALTAIDAGVRSHYLSVVGLVVTLPGLSLLLLGRRRTRMLLVPLALSLLMIPIPNSIASHLYLRIATATAVEPILKALGFPAFREQTVIMMPEHVFVVSDACSGFATLYAALAVAIILACYCRSHWRRGALLLAALPLALGSNIVRVLMLLLLTTHSGSWILDTPLHEASGVVTFCVILGGLFAIADRSTLRQELA